MRKRIMSLVGIVAASLLMAGCLVIPLDHHVGGSRHNLGTDKPDGLVVGTTTREEVLLRFGEPDHVSADEREMWYEAERHKLAIIVCIPLPFPGAVIGGAGVMQRRYFLILRFDPKGVLVAASFGTQERQMK